MEPGCAAALEVAANYDGWDHCNAFPEAVEVSTTPANQTRCGARQVSRPEIVADTPYLAAVYAEICSGIMVVTSGEGAPILSTHAMVGLTAAAMVMIPFHAEYAVACSERLSYPALRGLVHRLLRC